MELQELNRSWSLTKVKTLSQALLIDVCTSLSTSASLALVAANVTRQEVQTADGKRKMKSGQRRGNAGL